MDGKKTVIIILQVVAVCIVIFTAQMLVGMLIPIPDLKIPSEQEIPLLPLFLLIVSVTDALIISYIVRRSNWHGCKLALAVFILLIGNRIFEEQIDGIFLMDYLGLDLLVITLMSLQTLIVSGIGSICAVLILCRSKQSQEPVKKVEFDIRVGGWVIRWICFPLLFIVIYYLCGGLLAWINPAVREYYGGGGEINLVVQALLQIPRGLGWFAMAVLIVKMMRGINRENAVVTGIVFGVLHANSLIIPNPFMPFSVRMSHIVEIFVSLFIFGYIAAFFIKTKKEEQQAVSLI
jgi:hypothetical protein